MEGYSHPLYAQSFQEIGQPIFLPSARGWLIKRKILGTEYYDAMAPYPLFSCEDWNALPHDLDQLRHDLVSVTLVLPPLIQLPLLTFQNYFDVFYSYKDHYILDFSIPLENSISKGRRKDARRALKQVFVEVEPSPLCYLEEWFSLYQNLISKHNITGIRTFSRASFERQLSIPGMTYFRAMNGDQVVGGNLYLLHDDIVYFHLSAFAIEGYKLDAAYAIQWFALQYFLSKAKWMNLGGGTTAGAGQIDGLDKFKMGWSSSSAKSLFCGKILDQTRYMEITSKKNQIAGGWFPAYRYGDY